MGEFAVFEKGWGFLTSVSTYIELPTIEDGYWKLVDRNPGTKMYTNVSFVYMMQKIKLHI